jgi:hypothetical protein
MNIFDFIDTESQKFKDLNDKDKASALLNSVNQRIQINKNNIYNPKTDVTTMFKPLNQEEFYLAELLKFYINNNSFSVGIIRETDRDTEIFENIKKQLRRHFIEQ